MPEAFHFLQPDWFYLLVPLAIILLLLLRPGSAAIDPWQKIIDQNLLQWLRVESTGRGGRLSIWLLSAGWLIAVIALANPVWEKLPQPVFQTDQARVIVLDLSLSMNSSDLKPSRMERARFKVSDILAKQQEGVLGLVVFAGDAFIVSPLTRDSETIAAMLPALKPDIMPVQGSRVDLGLIKAGELLKQAGRVKGEVLLLADGYSDEQAVKAAKKLQQQGVITSVLGIGTREGAPLPSGRGDFIRNGDGELITTKLDEPAMRKLAAAGGGDYISLTASNADINNLMSERVESSRHHANEENNQATRWKETGPMLVLLLLPLAALAFRRGWLISIALLVATGLPNQPAIAFTMQDLWQRQDQQAHKALLAGNADKAAGLAQDPLRRGAAEYKQGNFDAAVKDFDSASGADAAYNKGNALAKLGKYKEAIEAYEKALKQNNDMPDARYNKEVVEKLLQQQQQNKGKDGEQDKENQQGQQGKQDKQGSQENGQQSKGDQNQQQDQQPQSQQSDPQSGQQDSSDGDQQQEQSRGSSQQDEAEPAGNNDFADAAEKAKQQETADDEGLEQDEMAVEEKKDSKGNDSEKNEQQLTNQANQSEEEGGQPESPAGNKADTIESNTMAEELSSEEKIAAEQWLRRIPDDPAGLLRRKLRYQYIRRGGQSENSGEAQAW